MVFTTGDTTQRLPTRIIEIIRSARSMGVIKLVFMCLLGLSGLFAGMGFANEFSPLRLYVIEGNSMEPTYPEGSIVAVRRLAKADQPALGSVITFHSGNTTVTHRICSREGPFSYRTKGDGNEDFDSAVVTRDQIVGLVVACIPINT